MPKVNGEILKWARTTAGLDERAAAKKAGVSATKSRTAEERILDLEAGSVEPTLPLLKKLAKAYRRPLVTFYLAHPPARAERGADYRTVAEPRLAADEARLDALVRDVRARQEMVRALLEDEDEAKPLNFVGSASPGVGVDQLARQIRSWLSFDLDAFRKQKLPADAFSYVRRLVEARGVFVLVIGDLGSHHTALDVETFRGIAIADSVAPFVVINDHDAKTAWTFSLLHEVVHLWLGESAISGPWGQVATERFCNEVASEIVLPTAELTQGSVAWSDQPGTLVGQVSSFGRTRNVSGSLVAYRLWQQGRISERAWGAVRDELRRRWAEQRRQEKSEGGETTGPSYYTVRRYKLGHQLTKLMARMLMAGAVTPTKAGRVLGVKPTNVYPLLQADL